jgi:flagellar operon protein
VTPLNPKISSLGSVSSGITRNQAAGVKAPGKEFLEILHRELDQAKQLNFSKHAQERMESRDIQLTPTALEKLSAAMDQAEAKGSRESLVLMDGLALIVSVPNKTVITAMDGESLKEKVFTNIDSAVIL